MACTCSPGKAICRSCLNPTTKLKPYTGNTVNGNGILTIHQINIFQQEFERTIVEDTENNPLAIAVKNHGSENFYESVNTINDFFRKDYIVINFQIMKFLIIVLKLVTSHH